MDSGLSNPAFVYQIQLVSEMVTQHIHPKLAVFIFAIMLYTPGIEPTSFSKAGAGDAKSLETFRIESGLGSLRKANAWFNSVPLSSKDLRGKVVLLEFGTYTCINWLRTLPYVRAWAEKYKQDGLVVIEVHTPEFSFEKNVANVKQAIDQDKIDFPVAIDNDKAIWNAFNNAYWPAFYFIDGTGRIRHTQFGEGEYEQAERVIQKLLAESGVKYVDHGFISVEGKGIEKTADWSSLSSEENYLGYGRTQNFSALERIAHDKENHYSPSTHLGLNEWGLSGTCTVLEESIILNKPGAKILYRFHARDFHLVMGPLAPGKAVRFRVSIDGRAPGQSHGLDIDKDGNGIIIAHRLYQLIRQSSPVEDRTIEIEFIDGGCEAFSVTFG